MRAVYVEKWSPYPHELALRWSDGTSIDNLVSAQFTFEVAAETTVDLFFDDHSLERVVLVAGPQEKPKTSPVSTNKVKCKECSGTGIYTSPISGNSDRCSQGCAVPVSPTPYDTY